MNTPRKPAKPCIALVLGAGGARGLAHIGVIEALEAGGYRIAAISGCSMGALVGGIYATGRLTEFRDWVCALERRHVLRLLDFAFGHPGLIKGDRIMAALRELVGEHRIEELPIPYLAVATDLHNQREVWINRGPLFDAIRASIAIPMVFTPHRVDGRELVDGGLLAPVPIAATRLTHTDLVVAVDVNARSAHFPRKPRQRREAPVTVDAGTARHSASASLHLRIGAFVDNLLEKRTAGIPQPGLVDLMSRSLETMQGQITRQQLAMDPPDLLVQIPHDICFFYEFWRAEEMLEIGRAAARHALKGIDTRNE